MKEDSSTDLTWLKADIPREKSRQTIFEDIGQFSKELCKTEQVFVHFEGDEVFFNFFDEFSHQNLLIHKCEPNQKVHMYNNFLINVDGLILHVLIPDDSLKMFKCLFPKDKGRKIKYACMLRNIETHFAQETNFGSSGERYYRLPEQSIRNPHFGIEHYSVNAIVCSSSMWLNFYVDLSWSKKSFVVSLLCHRRKYDERDLKEKISTDELLSFWKSEAVLYRNIRSTDICSDENIWSMITKVVPFTKASQNIHMAILLTKSVSDVIKDMRLKRVGQDVFMASRVTKAGQYVNMAISLSYFGQVVMIAIRLSKIGHYVIMAMCVTKAGPDALIARRVTQARQDVMMVKKVMKPGQDITMAIWVTKPGQDITMEIWVTKAGQDVIKAIRVTKAGQDVIMAIMVTKAGKDVMIYIRMTKVEQDVIKVVRVTKARQDLLMTMILTKAGPDALIARRVTQARQDVMKVMKPGQDINMAIWVTKPGQDITMEIWVTKAGQDVIMAIRVIKAGKDVIMAIRVIKAGQDVIMAIRVIKAGKDVIMAIRVTKAEQDVIMAIRVTKAGQDVIMAIRVIKAGQDVIMAIRVTKAGQDVIMAIRVTKAEQDVIMAIRVTKAGQDVIMAIRVTKAGQDVIMAIRVTKARQDVIMAIRVTKAGQDVIMAIMVTKAGKDVIIYIRLTKVEQDVIKVVRVTKARQDLLMTMILTKTGQDVTIAMNVTKSGQDVMIFIRLTKIGQDEILAMFQTETVPKGIIRKHYIVDVILVMTKNLNIKLPLRILHLNKNLQVRDTSGDVHMCLTKRGLEIVSARKSIKQRPSSKVNHARKLVLKKKNTRKGKYAKEEVISKQKHFKMMQHRKRFSKKKEKQKKKCSRMFKNSYIGTKKMEKKYKRVKKPCKSLLGWSWNSDENLKMKYLKEENCDTDLTNGEFDITSLKGVISSLYSGASFHSDNFVYPLRRGSQVAPFHESDNSGNTEDDSNLSLQSDRHVASEQSVQESDLGTVQSDLPVPEIMDHHDSAVSTLNHIVTSSSPSLSNRITATSSASANTEPGVRNVQYQSTHQSRPLQQPQYQMFASYHRRMRTFRHHSCPHWPRVESLVLNGFFYEVEVNGVRCFYCGGGLRDWNTDDDPWIEHARWFPHCSYLRQLKGQEFINMVQQAAADVQSEETDEASLRRTQNRRCRRERRQSSATGDSTSNDRRLRAEALPSRRQVSQQQLEENVHSLHCQICEYEHFGVSLPTVQRTIPPDLVEIIEENRSLKRMVGCIKCDNEKNTLFLPCTHFVLCQECAQNTHTCPVCGNVIRDKIKTFR